jgi:hypothetical protein
MSLELIKEVKDFLSQKFEMKDLGEADVILNIKLIKGENGGVTLSQTHKWICVHTWRWCCFLEVLQADHFNQVNNGSRTHNIGHYHCRG